MIEFFGIPNCHTVASPSPSSISRAKVLLDVDHVIDQKVGECGHIILSRRQKNGTDKWEMYEPNGKPMKLPAGVNYIKPISKTMCIFILMIQNQV